MANKIAIMIVDEKQILSEALSIQGDCGNMVLLHGEHPLSTFVQRAHPKVTKTQRLLSLCTN